MPRTPVPAQPASTRAGAGNQHSRAATGAGVGTGAEEPKPRPRPVRWCSPPGADRRTPTTGAGRRRPDMTTTGTPTTTTNTPTDTDTAVRLAGATVHRNHTHHHHQHAHRYRHRCAPCGRDRAPQPHPPPHHHRAGRRRATIGQAPATPAPPATSLIVAACSNRIRDGAQGRQHTPAHHPPLSRCPLEPRPRRRSGAATQARPTTHRFVVACSNRDRDGAQGRHGRPGPPVRWYPLEP
ncbi:hypothetical protein SAMN05216270_114116 [Glycomyces harbinensis]|uniref:Uncharacterized protein n=1 Tax=Glycomyces harbinensis TaxID=58114 RepID=A0A1G7AS94_9ACTN|nr:hypothetical protein SAMN05216270_114116 [Glycomyces harbinensis]